VLFLSLFFLSFFLWFWMLALEKRKPTVMLVLSSVGSLFPCPPLCVPLLVLLCYSLSFSVSLSLYVLGCPCVCLFGGKVAQPESRLALLWKKMMMKVQWLAKICSPLCIISVYSRAPCFFFVCFSPSPYVFVSSLCFLFPAVRGFLFSPSQPLGSALFPLLVLCLVFSVQDEDNGGKSMRCCWLMDQNSPLVLFLSQSFLVFLFLSSPPLRSLILSGFIAREC